jgi:hypothetical protein
MISLKLTGARVKKMIAEAVFFLVLLTGRLLEEQFIDILEEISVNINTSEVNPSEIRRNRE